MDTLIAVATGVAVLLLALWLGKRQADQAIPPELREAMRLEKPDPARSAMLADSYFRQGAAREEQERAYLWQRAPTDLEAAEELRTRLLQDLEADHAIQDDLRKSGDSTPDLLRNLGESQDDTRKKLTEVETMIHRLRSGP